MRIRTMPRQARSARHWSLAAKKFIMPPRGAGALRSGSLRPRRDLSVRPKSPAIHLAATFFGFFGRDSIGITRLVVFFNLRSILIRTRRFFAAVVRGRIGSSPGGSFPQIDTIYPKGPRG